MSDKIAKFEVDPEQYQKLVDDKLLQIRDVLAPEEFGEEMAKIAEEGPDAVPEARMQRIILDMYAGQEALFAAGPNNISILGHSGLISEKDAAVLYVMARLLESKVAEALERSMNETEAEYDKQQAKPKLSVVTGGRDDDETVH